MAKNMKQSTQFKAFTKQFIVIAGPCVIENKRLTIAIAQELKEILAAYPITFIFKASFDKANRTAITSFRGPGIVQGLKILDEVKRKVNVPILTDVHTPDQVARVKKVADIIQIPAFLSRQTDLVVAAAQTGKIVNIKKAQFLSPDDVGYITGKARAAGNSNLLITERGTSFGYNNLVVDFRSFLIMRKFGYPVIYDVTHSLQRPSAVGGVSGGDVTFVEPMALAATACGIDGLFLEVHPKPTQALSDKYTSFPLAKMKALIKRVMAIEEELHEKEK